MSDTDDPHLPGITSSALVCGKPEAVIRGTSIPRVVELISGMAELSGGLPVLFTETWENKKLLCSSDKSRKMTDFFLAP
jgi:hypothetical protein